jgi:hypothetical protein
LGQVGVSRRQRSSTANLISNSSAPGQPQIARPFLALVLRIACKQARRYKGIEEDMSARTIHSIAHFGAAFVLGGLEGKLPAGDYDIDHDEEMINGLSWVAWRRVATFIHLPARTVKGPNSQLVAIDQTELETALRRDRENAA